MKAIRILFTSIAAIAILFATFIPAGAEENTEKTINEHLVAFWNFEGEGDEALKNKAPLREENPLLKNGNVTVTGGTAVVPSEAGAYLQASDLTDWTAGTQVTIYLRLKITGDTTSYANFVYAGGSFRMYARRWTANGNYIIEGKTGHTPRLEEINVGMDENGRWNNGDWIYAALAMNVDGSDHHSRLYLSLDGKNWRMRQTDPVGTPRASIADFLNNPEAVLLFGKANGTDEQTAGFEYDDIRIYNRVLTYDEIMSIQPNSLELKAPEQNTGESGTGEKPQVTLPSLTEKPSVTDSTPSATGSKSNRETEQPGAEKAGCASSVGIALVFPVSIAAVCAAAFRKKQEKRSHRMGSWQAMRTLRK